MLIDLDTGKVIDEIPHRPEFDALRRRLSDKEFDAMVTRVNPVPDTRSRLVRPALVGPTGVSLVRRPRHRHSPPIVVAGLRRRT